MNINTQEYWDREWSTRDERTYPYYPKIAELVGGKRVLDFGCGRGTLMRLLPNSYGIDISEKAIEIVKERGMNGHVGTEPKGIWDVIVSTEVLEHLDDDAGMLKKFFKHTDTVIYSVPHNSLGPDVEPEHQRIYTKEYVKKITPYLKRIWEIDNYLLVLASKNDFPLKPSVLVAIPNEGSIRVELANALIQMSHDQRHELKIYYPQGKPIDHNRNQIVRRFLEGTWEYLLMIDSDNPPLRNPLDLVRFDKDVIACPTPQWNSDEPGFPIYWVAMDEVKEGFKEHKEKKGLQKVDAVGAGCILIARRVLEKVKAPFMRKWNEDGTQDTGLDFHFCQKARKQGFEVWAHYDYPCSHFKELDLVKVLKI